MYNFVTAWYALRLRYCRHMLVGPVVVSKMPALHPGDVRKLQAVAIPGLEHLHDVIVFPRKVKYCVCFHVVEAYTLLHFFIFCTFLEMGRYYLFEIDSY